MGGRLLRTYSLTTGYTTRYNQWQVDVIMTKPQS